MRTGSLLLGLCAVFLWAGYAQSAVWYVDRDVAAGGDGTTWARAFQTIQPGNDAAFADGGGEVWVAEGVYDEARAGTGGALVMCEGVNLYGGFSGAETQRTDRDWTVHETVIDGAYALSGSPAENVVVGASNCVLDGFVVRGAAGCGIRLYDCTNVSIQHCQSMNNAGGYSGGGLRAISSNEIQVTECSFENNGANRGGGVYITKCTNIVLQLCTFTHNWATELGGGAFLSACERPELLHCSWTNNTAENGYGGAVYFDWAQPVLFEGCRFQNNQAKSGGAVYDAGPASIDSCYPSECPEFTSCVFWNNTATVSGGGALSAVDFYTIYERKDLFDPAAGRDSISVPMRERGGAAKSERKTSSFVPPTNLSSDEGFSPPIISGCTFVGNASASDDGVIFVDGTAYGIPVTDCIFWNNPTSVIKHGPGIASTMQEYVSFCDLQADLGDCVPVYSFSIDPLFLDETNGDFRLRGDSLCIDRGESLNWDLYGYVTEDYLGHSRGLEGDGLSYTGDFDIGAFEFVLPGCSRYHSSDSDADGVISLSELLRVIQFFNSDSMHCDASSEDGYAVGGGDQTCCAHASDYNPQDWRIEVSELLRVIQFFNSAGYQYCPSEATEDVFCPVQTAR